MSIVSNEKYTQSPYEVGRVSLIRSLLPPGKGKHALDLGCGSGFFSSILVENGWKVTAADMEKDNVERVAQVVHSSVVGEALAILDGFGPNRFDLILALELIEHISNGELLLQKLHRSLAGHGTLLISTPNRVSPEGLGGYYWGEKIRGWGKWTAWDDTHVKIFSSFEFLRLLRQTGWVIEKVIGYWYRGLLPAGVTWSLPFSSTSCPPFNRLGFNTIVRCRLRK